MKLAEAMAELEGMGTAQNVKVYKRHGCGDNVFGVSFANLNLLKKRIKVDHGLAGELWQTGNSMIADSARITSSAAEKWLKDIDYYLLADLFAGLVARSPAADAKLKKWMASKKEYARQTGYGIL